MNQRSIKFRAWDGEKMCRWEDIKRDFGCLLPVEKGEGIMQFTGLLDKNGKGIWEGDIVKDLFSKNQYQIIFEEATFKGQRKSGWITLGYGYGSNLEIIGNIYENPELLI